jgi:hypothetical protein
LFSPFQVPTWLEAALSSIEHARYTLPFAS